MLFFFSQAEIDAPTGEWFYFGIAWRMKTGLVIYVNGKQAAADKGGVGVQNMKDWTGQENFLIGRNVGESGQVFANFYLASMVVFNQYLEAPAMYSAYKYYNNDGERIKCFKSNTRLMLMRRDDGNESNLKGFSCLIFCSINPCIFVK